MQEAVRGIRDILAKDGIDVAEKSRMEHYLALMEGDLERLQIPSFAIAPEQRKALHARAKEVRRS